VEKDIIEYAKVWGGAVLGCTKKTVRFKGGKECVSLEGWRWRVEGFRGPLIIGNLWLRVGGRLLTGSSGIGLSTSGGGKEKTEKSSSLVRLEGSHKFPFKSGLLTLRREGATGVVTWSGKLRRLEDPWERGLFHFEKRRPGDTSKKGPKGKVDRHNLKKEAEGFPG